MTRLLIVLLLAAAPILAADPEPVAPADLVEWLQLRSQAAEIERDFAQNEAEINKWLEAMRRRHRLATLQNDLLARFEELQTKMNAMREQFTAKYNAEGFTMNADGTWTKTVAQGAQPPSETPRE